ncbi:MULTISPECIES: hypothetical protein [unclassified Leucobacter]|uniref:hypothetical protein n=1 Tax=unclassified Leucobacter TaxID=2621730 RepID=UPI003017DCA5
MTNRRTAPTATETLERAISKLEKMRDEAGLDLWAAPIRDPFDPDYDIYVYEGPGLSTDRCIFTTDSKPHVDAILALSRTVDPMLDMLRFARGLFGAQIHGEQAAATVDLALYLARAILGEETDHGR